MWLVLTAMIVAFVQADELWNYDKEQDQLSLLFSFRDAENADVRNKVSDHKIQILNMDKKRQYNIFGIRIYEPRRTRRICGSCRLLL